MFLLCRRYYKEEEELVLDVGLFVKVLEVLKIMNNVVYIYMYKIYKGSVFRVVKFDFFGIYNFNFWNFISYIVKLFEWMDYSFRF